MKLVFYSGGDHHENLILDEMAIHLSEKVKPTITFIPSTSYDSEVEYREMANHLRNFGVTKILHFPVDIPFDQTLKNEVLRSDVIHLGGGNTYYFLKHLKRSGMLKELKDFVNNGGVLTGLSAGAIIMTPNIETAGFPHFDCDENFENIKNMKSMGLINFEFFPHYKNSKRYDEELRRYSRESERPLYACYDGSGIVIDNDMISFYGRCFCFYKGKKVEIHSKKNLSRALTSAS